MIGHGMNGLTLFFCRISRHGLLGALKLIPVNVRWAWRQLRPSNLRVRRRERALDRELGIDTAGIVTKGALQAETKTTNEITFYQPVPLQIFEEMTAGLPSPLSSFCFLDIGSGKGRALVLAARLGFEEVTGVELSPILHKTAEKNLARLRGSQFSTLRVLNMDARAFEFSAKPMVLFLGNPFGEEITREVIINIERAYSNSNDPVFLLYHWPVHKEVLEERGMWQEISRGAWRRDFGFEWRNYTLVSGQRHS
jgi:SAM-dependent methyltransferase